MQKTFKVLVFSWKLTTVPLMSSFPACWWISWHRAGLSSLQKMKGGNPFVRFLFMSVDLGGASSKNYTFQMRWHNPGRGGKSTLFFLPNCFALGNVSKENTLGPFSVSARARQDVAVDLEKGKCGWQQQQQQEEEQWPWIKHQPNVQIKSWGIRCSRFEFWIQNWEEIA